MMKATGRAGRSFAILGLTAALAMGLSAEAGAAKTRITMWIPWEGPLAKACQDIANAYSKVKPNVEVKMLPVYNDLATNGEKFMASMIAGAPPEIVLVDGPQVINWAAQGLLSPLDKLYASYKVSSSEFWTPSWKQTLWKGKSYAVPLTSDPNFPLIYNKKAFDEAGLGQAPATFAEFEAYADKLFTKDANGRYKMAGFMPWWHCGMANMLFTFGWMFGGEFYDTAKDKVTVTDPGVVKALSWFESFARKYKIGELDRAMGAFGNNPIVSGKVAMLPYTSDFLDEARIKKFPYGWGNMPVVPGGPEKSAWIGGWTAGIPKNAKKVKEAFEFLKWLCVDDEGTTLAFKYAGFTMSARKSPIYTDPDVRFLPWLKSFDRAEFVRPVSPVAPQYFRYLDVAVNDVIHGKKAPAAALNTANVAIQKELDKLLARVKK